MIRLFLRSTFQRSSECYGLMSLVQPWRLLPSLYGCSRFFQHDFHSLFLPRYLTPLKKCLVYGGARLALLPFFLSTQQASTFRAKAVLDNACLNLLSRRT